ncbi:arylsulfatase [Catalinimonas alkaloidigena]|uniref:Arylsulfatase n=1 Tax=Catalinimonas alkaloidigena TaxID=1075417 RepID=A0A1G9PD35_9BACT|nr:sulfatase [Catalinimonas alkaloidigena]SDL96678.1 arylsulfatase [Catalinimonas alkaloidigena]
MFIRIIFGLALIGGLAACATKVSEEQAPQEGDRPPNVIIIFTDDQGYADVGCFGATGFQTPHLDQMAREGVRLTDFHAAQPVCSASRAGLLTGCYPNRIGINNAFIPHAPVGLNPSETTLAEMLKQEGYRTAMFGKWHLGDYAAFMPNQQGFDEYFGIPYSNDMWPHHPQQGSVFHFGPLPLYENEQIIDTLDDQSMLTTQLTEHAVAFIERNRDQPFFLYVAHPQPHVPLFVSDKFKGKSELGLYGDVIMELDWSVGQILEAVEQAGIDEQTMVIFTSDNGPWLSYGEHSGHADPLREGKGTSFEGGHREPFILRYPGVVPANLTVDVPVMAIDLLPTIAALTHSTLPDKKIDGKDVWHILTGQSTESPHEAYYFYYHVNELEAVRQGDWKLYFPHTYRTLGGREGGQGGLPADYTYVTLTEPELYNLKEDVGERHNVAAAHPDVVTQLTALGEQMRTELGDNLTGRESGVGSRAPGKVPAAAE